MPNYNLYISESGDIVKNYSREDLTYMSDNQLDGVYNRLRKMISSTEDVLKNERTKNSYVNNYPSALHTRLKNLQVEFCYISDEVHKRGGTALRNSGLVRR